MAFDDLTQKFRPRNYRKSLAPQDADTALDSLKSVGTSALQSGLYALDTPGATIRGGLGRMVGAKASDGDRVSGRDLTDAIGLTDRHNKGWGSWGVGLGAEILTDPLSYVSPFALTRAGKAASKLGATKGFTRRQLVRGFDDTADNILARGTQSDLDHAINQGRKIASPDVERGLMQADPQRYVSQIGRVSPLTRKYTRLPSPVPAPSVAKEPLMGMAGIGLPFADPSFHVGTGQIGQNIAGRIDRTLGNLKYGTMLGRWGNGLFDHRVKDAQGGAVQRAAVEAGHPVREALQREAREYHSDVLAHLDDGIVNQGIAPDDLLRGTRHVIEGVGANERHLQTPSAIAAGQRMADTEVSQILRDQALGISTKDPADRFIRYGPRAGIDIRAAQARARGGVPRSADITSPQMINVNGLPVVAGENIHRQRTWRDIPGGTNQANDFVRQYGGSTLSTGQIENDLWHQMINTAGVNGHRVDLDMSVALKQKARAIATRVKKLPPEHSANGIGIFDNNEVANVARSGESFAQKQANAHTIHGTIGNEARLRTDLPADAVPISQVLKDMGLTYNRLGDAATAEPAVGAMVTAYQRLARQGAGKVDPLLYAPTGHLKAAVDQYALPRQVYDQLVATQGKWSTPASLSGPLQAAKDMTSTFKNMVYPLFLASNVRNLGTGLINNYATGTSRGAHAAAQGILRETATANQLRRFLPDMPAGLTDDQARVFARRQGFVDAKIGNGHSGPLDLDNNINARLTGTVPGRVIPEIPGAGRTGGGSLVGDTANLVGSAVRDQVGSFRGAFQNPFGPSGLRSPVRNPFRNQGPLAMEGVWGHGNTDFPALVAARKVGTNIEDYLRMAKYLGEREKGFAGHAAGDATRDLHFDYDQLTSTEKNLMRQVFPFYTYMRKNLPLQAKYLATSPVYPLTQMRVMEGLRDQSGGYTPAYLSSGAAVPIPGSVDGNQRYISGFGTPLEEGLERLRFRNGLPDPVATAQQYMASVNPLVRAPIEQIADRQFSTGRNLSDLRAQGIVRGIGGWLGEDNPQLAAQILANSPFSRFASTFDKLNDERKPFWARALNVGTGVKLTDVDVERQKAIEAAAVRNKLLSQSPHITSYTHYYPRHGEADLLTPREVELLRLQQTMKERALKIRKETDDKRIGVRLP